MPKRTRYLAPEVTVDIESPANLRACAYLRVSTGRQAEGDLSIPDQRKQVTAFCLPKCWTLVAEYLEPGASATDDQRPEFQKMIERACDEDHPFDVIVVHSYSRFFRDAFGLEMYIRKLAKAGVRLISITQELGDDPAQVMMRQVIALFDEYQSRENGKHVLRAMRENAIQGFYNGSPVPLGYKTEEVERRGARMKKKLVIDNVEQETVKLIYRLYLHGDGEGGPLGTKQLVKWLNSKGYRTRRGSPFGVGTIYGLLTNPVYVGEWTFNRRNSKTLELKPLAEQIVVNVPPIIERAEFDRVQKTLAARNPNVTAPRIVTGPILLTGLAVCATCGGAMTLRTGTSKNHRVYKYYTCANSARIGDAACKGRSVPMATLDNLVIEHVSEKLFTGERIIELLTTAARRRGERAAEVDRRVAALQKDGVDAEEKLKRLYRMVEEGITEMDDILTDRIAALRSERDRCQAALDRIRSQLAPRENFSSEAVERFGRAMRDNIANGSISFRKNYLKSVIDRIEVDDDMVRIFGETATLEQAIAGKVSVRSFVRKWRALRDSNS